MGRPGNLTIIVCALNEEAIITAKIENTFKNDRANNISEVLVVDDNSSDNTFDIVRQLTGTYDKLRIVRNSNKKGKWGALSTGIENALGEIICMTDADVDFDENTIQSAIRLFKDPSIGGVTSNQKISFIKKGVAGKPLITFYEKFRNFFRVIESAVDSTNAFHGQTMFFRKDRLKKLDPEAMADDVAIALLIRRGGSRTVFCKSSYYIEKMAVSFDPVSKGIFRRRAKAVAQTILKNRDILFRFRYGKFAFFCYPIEFFINIILPFVVVCGVIALCILTLLLPGFLKLLLLGVLALIFLFRKLALMAWYQILAVISYFRTSKNTCSRWTTNRDGNSINAPDK